MSLYSYRVTLPGGGEKKNKITARSESHAREKIAEINPGAKLADLQKIPDPTKSAAKIVVAPPLPPSTVVKMVPTPKITAPAKTSSAPSFPQLAFPAPTPRKTTPAATAPKPKANSKLAQMLFLQRGLCFFCGQPLDQAEASIEHLNPISNGGLRREDNEVVCHVSLNRTFGNLDLKRKFEFVLKSAGTFKCPGK